MSKVYKIVGNETGYEYEMAFYDDAKPTANKEPLYSVLLAILKINIVLMKIVLLRLCLMKLENVVVWKRLRIWLLSPLKQKVCLIMSLKIGDALIVSIN